MEMYADEPEELDEFSGASPIRRARRPRVESASLNLDLSTSQFAPLSQAEVYRRAKGVGELWGNPWFGRQDLIPPSSDERTALIDRAMVGQGYISPEELKEIHEVGEDMDKVRSDLAKARRMADEAVQRQREDRAKVKAQKKKEAAERERQHAEAVAKRRATDIIFLGRGVSRGLADRRANVERLQQLGLPVLATPADVAEFMEISISRLRWLAFHNEAATRTHYVRFTAPKRSGGTRELAAPHRSLRNCQQRILWNILDKVPAHGAAHGFVRSCSTATNAALHVGREVVVNTDLKDFFPSVTFPRVMGVFRQFGYSPAAATILALLCTECPRRTLQYAGTVYHAATGPRALPQGACTSPALSNLVTRKLDARLSGLADKLGWNYTRYADDATFSAAADAAGSVGYLLARVRHITREEGFVVNEKKTRVLRRSTCQTVTGVVVNERPGVPRQLVRRMRAILHRARREGLAAQNRRNHPHFEAWVGGMVAYICMINPRQGRPLQQALAEISR
jgi:retron-type reverse transcriptase